MQYFISRHKTELGRKVNLQEQKLQVGIVAQIILSNDVDGDGKVIRRTEDHFKAHHTSGDYNELTPTGATIGGVGSIPELSGSGVKDFDIIWCADKDGSTVTYRGYVRVGGKEYQIANIVNPTEGGDPHASHHDGRTTIIDFTTPGHNTYIRGRSNNAGDVVGSGILYNGKYAPSASVIKSFSYRGPEGYIEEDGYF